MGDDSRSGGGVEEGEGLEEVERERLVHGEVVLQLDVHPDLRPFLRPRNDLDDAAGDEGPEQLPGAAEVRLLRPVGLVRVPD